MSKVAFISTMESSPWGGSEELWSRSARVLIERGVAVAASVRAWPDLVRPIEELERAGCRVERRRPATLAQRLGRRLERKLGRGVDGRFAWLRQARPDLAVISQAGHYDGLEWMLGCATLGIPYATIAEAAGECYWPEDEEAALVRQGYRGARANFFVSERNKELAQTQLAVPLPKAKVVRNPFNVSFDAAPPWPEEDEAGTIRLACLARLDPKTKGQDVLFQVLAQEKWRRRPLQVALYGSGPNAAMLRELKDTLKLDSVTFEGHHPDVEGIWQRHHALVLPSRLEGLPLAIVEAMLCARPCIVTDVAGNAELIEDNRSGFVAAAPTVALLDEAMERAWASRAQWRQVGQAAAERVRQMVPRDPARAFAHELMHLLPVSPPA